MARLRKKGHQVAAPGGGSEPCDGCASCGNPKYFVIDLPAYGHQAIPGSSPEDAALRFILRYGKLTPAISEKK